MANDGISKAALQVVQAGQGQTPASSSAAESGGGDSGGGGDWNDSALANARDNHKNRMERIKQKYSSKKQQAEDDTTEADLQLERIDGEVDRPPRYIHPKIHLPILAVWMLLELPFNSQAFQLFLRDSVVASTGMALIVAFIFMLASDFT